jgi:hypothetical protein
MIGVTRGISTLAGAAVAGVLLWFATQIGTQTSSEYWATYGLIAAAGLTMALSQILGGWTKWGWPRFSLGVFLIGFLPVFVAGGWVLLARQPSDWMNTSNWSRDLGIFGAVTDVGNVLPAIAFGIGLVFGLSFDTAGPKREVVSTNRCAKRRSVTETSDARAADEPLTADRGPYAERPRRRRCAHGRRSRGNRDHHRRPPHGDLIKGFARRPAWSIGVEMDAAAVNNSKPAASELLLEHCHALDIDVRSRPTAADRLEALVGKELARRLVRALSASH